MPEATSSASIERRILQFFQEQPQAVETVRGIAAWVSAEAGQVQQALDQLTERKWLLTHESASVRGYVLTRDERILGQIQVVLGS